MRSGVILLPAIVLIASGCASTPLAGERPCPVTVQRYDGPAQGFGSGAYRDAQATPPVPLSRVDPRYTSAATKRRVEGEVRIGAVVLQNGTVGPLRITRPLDPELDVNALCAAAQWRFRPALLDGRPVDYVSTIVLEFRLH